jgi:hypothetical protein
VTPLVGQQDLLAAPTGAGGRPAAALPAGPKAAAARAPQPKAAAAVPSAAARRWQGAAAAVMTEERAPDGALVFSADNLQAPVDPQQLLLAALERARRRVAEREGAATAAAAR